MHELDPLSIYHTDSTPIPSFCFYLNPCSFPPAVGCLLFLLRCPNGLTHKRYNRQISVGKQERGLLLELVQQWLAACRGVEQRKKEALEESKGSDQQQELVGEERTSGSSAGVG